MMHDILQRLALDEIHTEQVVCYDYEGEKVSINVEKSDFDSAVTKGVRITDETSLDTAEPVVFPDPSTYVRLAYRQDTARLMAYIRPNGTTSDWEGCPRAQLKKMLDQFRLLPKV